MYMTILQTQSTTGAALEIIVMLLGAAIIGVLTTYYFMKSKYQKIIDSLESKLDESEREKSRLQSDLSLKNDELEKLRLKYDELLKKEENLKKTAAKGKASSKKLRETEQELIEREELLRRIGERKHMINYSRIGTARSEDKDDLKVISGIGPYIEEQLHALDIYTFDQISKFEKEDIEAVTEAIEFFPGRIERDEWVKQAKELAG